MKMILLMKYSKAFTSIRRRLSSSRVSVSSKGTSCIQGHSDEEGEEETENSIDIDAMGEQMEKSYKVDDVTSHSQNNNNIDVLKDI